MSNYEFWDELGKIFNAVVAYQEKTIEFNKRFINPWIRLGNVFDRQDRNEEAISAYQKAVEIDPNNAQNWYEVGNIHFRMEKYDEAVDDFKHAIDLDPGFGSPYSNLALTLVTQGKFTEAIPLYRTSIELFEDDKDKAEAWNRLGNLYRKLNEYDLAVESFHNADELDRDNAGFRDSLDEVPDAPTLVEASSDADQPAVPVMVSLSELISAEEHLEESVAENTEEAALVLDASTDVPTRPVQVIAAATDTMDEPLPEPSAEMAITATESQPAEADAQAEQLPADAVSEPSVPPEAEQSVLDVAAESDVEPVADPAVVLAASAEPAVEDSTGSGTDAVAETDAAYAGDETISVVVQSTIETFTENVTVSDTTTETTDAALTVGTTEEVIVDPAPTVVEVVVNNEEQDDSNPITDPEPAVAAVATTEETVAVGPVVVEPVALEPVVVEPVTLEPVIVEPVVVEPVVVEPVVVEPDVTESAVVEPAVAEPVVVEPVAVEPVILEITTLEQETVTVDTSVTETKIVVETTVSSAMEHPAYEEYLKDSNDPIHMYQSEAAEKDIENETPQVSEEPVAKINNCGEVQIEMDTKNAHVWNELGNVYFNTRAFDDAVIAYSKAIELDRWFAWPYSNLALTYVQKGRFVEAILLYQRSIELFSSDKDKAVSWNRLGNVYRRINDYENAIASYQRADELDPDNTTLSLQSRFSLLGSYVMEQKPSYVS